MFYTFSICVLYFIENGLIKSVSILDNGSEEFTQIVTQEEKAGK